MHGNLHISIQPTAHGEQLRLCTRNEGARARNVPGMMMGGLSLRIGVIAAAAGKPEKALAVFGLFGGIAFGTFVTNLFRAPEWIREREQQMRAIAEEAVELLA